MDYIFRTDRTQKESRPSSVIPLIIYTQNKQIISQMGFDLYWNNEANHLLSQQSILGCLGGSVSGGSILVNWRCRQ